MVNIIRLNKNISVIISQWLTILIFAMIIILSVAIPSIVRFYISFFRYTEQLVYFMPTCIILYFALIPAATADISLWLLLKKVKRGEVFTDICVQYLRILSYCCFAEALIFGILGYYYLLSFLLSFAALFMGIMLRVVKNCFEEAVCIKNENDFTI